MVAEAVRCNGGCGCEPVTWVVVKGYDYCIPCARKLTRITLDPKLDVCIPVAARRWA